MNKIYLVLSEIENRTTVDRNLVFEDINFQTKLMNLLNDPKNTIENIINQSVEYINNNY